MAGLIDLINFGQEELEQDRLEDAEKTFSKALEKCSTDDDRQEVLRCLLKLAGKYLRQKQSNKPKILFEYLEKTELQERTRVMEWLARVHQQTEDLAGAERIYTEIFELRARNWGPEHPDAVGALKTAALFRQMQGRSAEDLYVRAYQVSKEVSQQGLSSKPKIVAPAPPKSTAENILPNTTLSDLFDSKPTKASSSGESLSSTTELPPAPPPPAPEPAAATAPATEDTATPAAQEQVPPAPPPSPATPVSPPLPPRPQSESAAQTPANLLEPSKSIETPAPPPPVTTPSPVEAGATPALPALGPESDALANSPANSPSAASNAHAQKHGANTSGPKESAFVPKPASEKTDLQPDAEEDIEAKVIEARKKSAPRKSTLYLLDELLLNQAKAEIQEAVQEEKEALLDEVPDFADTALTLKASLQELAKEWEPFCNMITKQLVKLLQQSSNPAYRKTLARLTQILTESTPKTLDLDHPFIACQRRPACNYLDWEILKELAPVYAAYDGTWGTYPFEIGMIYAVLRRAFVLGPLHVDTLQSLYRLAHIYTNEMFGCYDLDFAAAAFRVCTLAFFEHPEIDELTRVRCRTNLASVLMSKNELSAAKETLKEAIKLADALEQVGQQELLSILKILADCTNKLGDYETTAGVYERIRNFQEATARDSGLFETLIQLIHNYARAGNMAQVQSYLQRIQWELDWFEDPNPMREAIATKAEELEEYFLAEQMLNAIMAQSKPTEIIAGRAATSLIRLYEKTGRTDLAARMRGVR